VGDNNFTSRANGPVPAIRIIWGVVMRPSLRIAAVLAALLLFTGVSHAQFHAGFGHRHATYFNVRTGPLSSFTYASRTYGYGYAYGSVYGWMPSWYYGPLGVPIWQAPIQVQPPIVIQNFVPPAIVMAPPARNGAIPPEFEPAPPPKAAPPKAAAPKAAKPAPPPPPPVILPDLPKVARPLGRADADRIAEAGRKAFAEGQYGRALELFRHAADITPKEPSAHYVIAQALFALGKYREAVAAIAAGMALRADWSEARFLSRDLYWKKPDVFDEHLKSLQAAVEAFPGDAALLFLLGHQLWFDGKHAEATPFILKARAVGNNATPATAFRVDD
jgi:hypothetical protein